MGLCAFVGIRLHVDLSEIGHESCMFLEAKSLATQVNDWKAFEGRLSGQVVF